MTEADWNSSTDPQAMLEFLRGSGRVSDRKLRLFACACARRLWPFLCDERSRRCVDAAEAFSDGAATAEELARARQAAASAVNTAAAAWSPPRSPPGSPPPGLPSAANARAAAQAAWGTADPSAWGAAAEAVRPLQYLHCCLCREFVGSPFRPLSALLPPWLSWAEGTIVRLARAAYEERHLPSGVLDAARLAILADALEDAGCTDAELLGHLRGPGPHYRGCHVLDALLAKW
jgi:hypothetical protein